MGIKSIHNLLRKICPDIYQKVKLSEFTYKKIAVDISLYLYKYKAIMGNGWINGFISLISCLRTHHIHPVFIYDNPEGFPKEKILAHQKRSSSKDKSEEKIYLLESWLNHYRDTGDVLPELLDYYQKMDKNRPVRLIGKTSSLSSSAINELEKDLEKRKSQVIVISKDDVQLTKDLFTVLSIPYFIAPGEAETLCCKLCKDGKVDCVLSEDTDVLAYLTPLFLSHIDTRDGLVILIEIDDLLNKLDMTGEQFQDLCIMCGTDYNDNIPKIGPDGAYKLLGSYGSIEKIEENKESIKAMVDKENGYKDTLTLIYPRVREIFNFGDIKGSNLKILYCGRPDREKLDEFIIERGIRISNKNWTEPFFPVLKFEE